VLADARQIDEPVDRSQQMVGGHMSTQAEAIKQRFLRHRPFAHQGPHPLSQRPLAVTLNQVPTTSSRPTFSTASAVSCQTASELSAWKAGFQRRRSLTVLGFFDLHPTGRARFELRSEPRSSILISYTPGSMLNRSKKKRS
jgi:hypothetical protein